MNRHLPVVTYCSQKQKVFVIKIAESVVDVHAIFSSTLVSQVYSENTTWNSRSYCSARCHSV